LVIWPDLELHRVLSGLGADGLACGASLVRSRFAACCTIAPQSLPRSKQSREIDGDGRTVRQLLTARKYTIDYYQREYKWQTKQVTELIDDLANKFLENYETGHDRSAVANYSHYFLGSIMISDKDGLKFTIQIPATCGVLSLGVGQRNNGCTGP
jgi:hypothetical protein